MVCALQTEGESISKLEKADVLELTVKHLRRLRKPQKNSSNGRVEGDTDSFKAGFTACASEVGRVLSTLRPHEASLAPRLMSHLGQKIQLIEQQQLQLQSHPDPPKDAPLSVVPPPTPSPDSDQGYHSGRDSSSPSPNVPDSKDLVWRPF